MKFALLTLALAFSAAVPSFASVCPSTSNTNTDCGYVITIGSGGAISSAVVAGANPYDGSDDALVGIVNNSGATYSGSFSLTGTGDGGGIFAFEGDGICTYVSASYCAGAASGYEGPGVTFSGISTLGDTGTVNVSNLLAGASTYFSLEGSPASIGNGGGPIISGGGGPVTGSTTPEPATTSLFAAGLLFGGACLRKRKKQ